jgi:hypothetical protein
VPYQAYGLSMALPFWEALAREKMDYTDLAWLRGLGKARLALGANDNARLDVAPYGDFYGWSTDQTVQVLRTAAARFQDGLAEAAAQRWLQAGHRTTDLPSLWYEVQEYITYDPGVVAADVTALPLDTALYDLQAGVLRSSWQPGALTLTFKAGVFGGRSNFDRVKAGGVGHITWGHDHNDDMSFWLYQAGWLAPEAAGYDAGTTANYTYKANQTAYHNSVLIDGQGMLGETRGASASETAYPWFFSRDAHTLQRAKGTAHYAVSAASGPALFDASLGLSRWDRVALLARDRYAMVHDDLVASSSHTYEWVCHFPDSATPDTASGWIEGLAHNGQALGVRMVAPASWSATTGSQTAQSINKLEPDGSIGYVRVRPTAAAAAQKLLAVLVPMAQTAWASRPAIAPLSSSEGLGAVVSAGSLQEKWIFGTANASAAAVAAGGGLSLTGSLVGLAAYTGSAVSRAVLVNPGTLADQSGARELLTSKSATMIEAEASGSALTVTGTAIQGFRAYAPAATTVTLNGAPVAFKRSGAYVLYGAQ